MNYLRKQALEEFLSNVNLAFERAAKCHQYNELLVTVLADLMQIQCLSENNTSLLEFRLPNSMKFVIERVAHAQSVSDIRWIEIDDRLARLEFLDEDDQDRFIQIFEMLQLSGQRLYPAPNIYLNLEEPDKPLCSKLLELLNDLSDRIPQAGKQAPGQKTESAEATDGLSNSVRKVWVGAIHLESELEEFGSLPDFSPMDPPSRCYLVEYDNGPWSWKLFFSKPGQYQSDGVFVTETMKEDAPRNGERYFNDASQDQTGYSVTLTMTRMLLHGEPAFIYRQQFKSWIGAFMGNLKNIDLQTVPAEWMDIFCSNSPGQIH